MNTETREVAEKIIAKFQERNNVLLPDAAWLVTAIDKALRKRDERAAMIAEKSHTQPCICTTCLIHAEIAAAIRKDD